MAALGGHELQGVGYPGGCLCLMHMACGRCVSTGEAEVLPSLTRKKRFLDPAAWLQ